MRVMDYLKIAFSRVRARNKKITIGIVCISIAILLLMFSNMFNVSLEKYKKSVQSAPEVRTIVFDYNKSLYQISYQELVKKIEELDADQAIIMIEKQGENKVSVECEEIFKEEAWGCDKSFTGISESELEALGIDMRFSDNNTCEVLLPDKISYMVSTDYYDEENFRYISEEWTVDCTELVGKYIKCIIDEKEYEFKVIGTYNTNLINTQTCYASREVIQNIQTFDKDEFTIAITVNDILQLESLKGKITTMLLKLNGIDFSEVGIPENLSLDKIQENYEEQLIKYFEIHKEHEEFISNFSSPIQQNDIYTVMGITEKSVKTFNIVETFSNILAWSILIITIIYINTKNIYDKSLEFGTLKTQGFSNKEIHIIGIIESIILLSFSIVIAGVLYFLLNIGVTQIFSNLENVNDLTTSELQNVIALLTSIPRNMNHIIIIEIFIIVVLMMFFTFIANTFILKRNINELLKERKDVTLSDMIHISKHSKIFVHVFSITVLFLIIMIINDLQLFIYEYYNKLIIDTSYEFYDTVKELEKEEGIERLSGIEKEQYRCLLQINTDYTGKKYTYSEIQKLESLPFVEKTYESISDYFTIYYLIVDEWEHMSIVKTLAKTNNYGTSSYVTGLDKYVETYNIISIFLDIAIFAITILIMAIFIMFISRMLEEERENIGISKAVGYSNFRIWKKMIFKTLLIIIIAYIINCIILIGINQIIDLLLESYGFSNYNEIVRNTWNINILWTFGLIAVFISIYTMIRIRKTNIIEILK